MIFKYLFYLYILIYFIGKKQRTKNKCLTGNEKQQFSWQKCIKNVLHKQRDNIPLFRK